MPKIKKESPKQSPTDFLSPEMQIMEWAHDGTKEGVKNLERFLEESTDDVLRSLAEMALEEARFHYLSPNNKREEEDFELARMIAKREERLFDLRSKLEAAELELARMAIDKKVHEVLLANSNKERKEMWKYHFSEDEFVSSKMQRDELFDWVFYEDAWIAQARRLIKTKKYQNVPAGEFDSWHDDTEGVSWKEGDLDDDLGFCPACGSDDIEELED